MRARLSRRALADLDRARREGRPLLESEALDLLEELGIEVPARRFVHDADEVDAAAIEELPGSRLVVKAVVPGLVHKTEYGAVATVERDVDAVRGALVRMTAELSTRAPAGQPVPEVLGFLLLEYVEHPGRLGGELLLSASWSDDFGPLVTVGAGGTDAELLASLLEGGRGTVVLSPSLRSVRSVEKRLHRGRFLSAATAPRRGQPAAFDRGALLEAVERMLDLAAELVPETVAEIEVNPLVSRSGRAVALDAVVRPGRARPEIAVPRPRSRLRSLLEPRSVALVGVSERAMNPGRRILHRLLAAGYPHPITVIKPGVDRIDDRPCVGGLEELDAPVDLLVVAVAAEAAAAVVERALDEQRARSVLLIPGGFEERGEESEATDRLRAAIGRSRLRADGGAVVNGGNCLGVQSLPGRVDTLFIPETKLPPLGDTAAPFALLSQSGAFAIARTSQLAPRVPRYLISVGNQIDLTVADYLDWLRDDPEVAAVGCYVEGFRPLDGERFLAAAAELRRLGRAVVLYRGGRTESGASAAASHTAAVAGSFTATRELAEAAGVLVADTLEDFDDLLRLHCALHRRPAGGARVAALSNAGFECVVLADGTGSSDDAGELAVLGAETRLRLERLFRERRLDALVGVRNPLDTTPMLDDEGFVEAARALLDDAAVDGAVIACVPLTGALDTLARGPGHDEDVEAEGSVASRLGRLFEETEKPWVAVVDSGAPFDPMATVLERHGLPVFRRADRALRLLGRWLRWRDAG